MQVTPALLETDANALKQKATLVEANVDMLQIDVGDGSFIPTTTVLPRALGEFRPLTSIEVHLMVAHPERFVADWVHLGATRVTFHVESEGDLERFISQCRELDCDVTIARNPGTPLEKLEPFLDLVDEVMFLGVQPGAQGNPFIPSVLDDIQIFHKSFPAVQIALDGGVSESNIAAIAAASVRRVVVGATLWKSADPVAMLVTLSNP
ncbi:MAG: hypothetical protein AAB445_02065 [Patescibacteria group bacterium]